MLDNQDIKNNKNSISILLIIYICTNFNTHQTLIKNLKSSVLVLKSTTNSISVKVKFYIFLQFFVELRFFPKKLRINKNYLHKN